VSTRLFLTGADGMVGSALTAALAATPATRDWIVCGVSVRDFDIGDGAAVIRSIGGFRPDVVIHAAANAVVDSCESDPKAALRVNVAGTRNVVDACRPLGSRLIYLSSDYVFAGDATPAGGYREDDTPSPLSVYGVTSWPASGSARRSHTAWSCVRRGSSAGRTRAPTTCSQCWRRQAAVSGCRWSRISTAGRPTPRIWPVR